jgi:hypothetical protein
MRNISKIVNHGRSPNLRISDSRILHRRDSVDDHGKDEGSDGCDIIHEETLGGDAGSRKCLGGTTSHTKCGNTDVEFAEASRRKRNERERRGGE